MMYIAPIDYETIKPWIINVHYAKRMPSVSYSFGLFRDSILVGVLSYGIPASPFLCVGVCGVDWKDNVLELNRLAIINSQKNDASYFISGTLKLLPSPTIVVSYADTEWNHIGYVYQATNWIYTGCTKERTDMYSASGHSRHNGGDSNVRQSRSAKHRYIYFVGDRRQVKLMRKALNYPVLPYPKGDSTHYDITESVIDGRQMVMPL